MKALMTHYRVGHYLTLSLTIAPLAIAVAMLLSGCDGGGLHATTPGLDVDLWWDRQTGEWHATTTGAPTPDCELIGSVQITADD
jgi:hypothetical protein